MNVSLRILSPAKFQGKVIPVLSTTPFLIGRSHGCHLQPNHPAISQRHCALIVRGEKLFVYDFDSKNGTFINSRQIKGQLELRHGDLLRVGPLEFLVCLEVGQPATKLAAVPAGKAEAEDSSIIMLLLKDKEEGPAAQGAGMEDASDPANNTIADAQAASAANTKEVVVSPSAASKDPAVKQQIPDPSAAARSILEKHLRTSR